MYLLRHTILNVYGFDSTSWFIVIVIIESPQATNDCRTTQSSMQVFISAVGLRSNPPVSSVGTIATIKSDYEYEIEYMYKYDF